jgi:hypothetical protein
MVIFFPMRGVGCSFSLLSFESYAFLFSLLLMHSSEMSSPFGACRARVGRFFLRRFNRSELQIQRIPFPFYHT